MNINLIVWKVLGIWEKKHQHKLDIPENVRDFPKKIHKPDCPESASFFQKKININQIVQKVLVISGRKSTLTRLSGNFQRFPVQKNKQTRTKCLCLTIKFISSESLKQIISSQPLNLANLCLILKKIQDPPKISGQQCYRATQNVQPRMKQISNKNVL